MVSWFLISRQPCVATPFFDGFIELLSPIRIPMDPNLRTLVSMWIDPPGKSVKVEIGSDVGTSLDFLDVRISGLWVDTPDPFFRFRLQIPQSEI